MRKPTESQACIERHGCGGIRPGERDLCSEVDICIGCSHRKCAIEHAGHEDESVRVANVRFPADPNANAGVLSWSRICVHHSVINNNSGQPSSHYVVQLFQEMQSI